MDGLSSLTASQKVLDAVRSLPAWLLTTLLASAVLVSLTPLHQGLPDVVMQWLPLATIVLAIALFCRLCAEVLISLKNRRSSQINQDRERLKQIYRPLKALFLTRHVTSSTSICAPYFKDRLKNAIEKLGAYRRWRVGIINAWHALFDYQMSTSAMIEYGGYFPMDKIFKIIQQNLDHSDPELLELVRRANRSQYDDQDTELLTKEEYALFEHIHMEHERLSRKVA